MNPKFKTPVLIWLASLCGLIFAMVIVGGLTRLTHSGLSMVEWKPLMGTIPPISQADWMKVFNKYQQFPEYKLVNQNMTLSDFKYIFYWEYLHRLLGRVVGVIFLLPFLYFSLMKAFTLKLSLRMMVGFILGGLQGLMGWYMVKSGLVNVAAVSHYRLAGHLLLAILIFAYLFWIFLDIKENFQTNLHPWYKRSFVWTSLVLVQIVYGAFVAGRHAGLGYNTFPLMGDSLIPKEVFSLSPLWINFFENNTGLQFMHRTLAWILTALFAYGFIKINWRHSSLRIKKAVAFLGLAFFIQFALGVLTLLNAVPIHLAASHQGGAVVLLTASLYFNHSLKSMS